MDSTYYHLLINELPLIGVIIGIVVLVIGLLIKNISVKRTALGIFMLSGLLTIPSYITGKKAQEILSSSPEIDPEYISAHANAAYEFLRMVTILAILSIITYVVDIKGNRKATTILYIVTLAGSIFMFLMTQSVGNSGREINHPEIRINKPE
jgi:hypothetical membrane protein